MRMMERCDGNDVVGGKTIKMKMKIAMVVGVRKEVFSKAEIGTRGTLDGWKGVGLNLHTYRIVLDGLVGKGEIGESCLLLEEMLEKCLFPRSSTFDNIIFQMCQKDLFTEAMELTKKVVAKSFLPGASTWEALLLNSGSKLGYSKATFSGLLGPI